MSNLFSSVKNTESEPLAYRMRPRTLEEYIGQDHIIGKGKLLRRAIQADLLSSIIFYGPPGTGKTTLARVIANTTKSYFSTLNAVLSGVKELRYEIDQAKQRAEMYGVKTILFVDEVHRWNKSQQDALLPWVENGTVILIGATTENPYFEVNAALVSRSRIFQLKSLDDNDLAEIAKQALADKERGYGNYKVEFEIGALDHLIKVSSGDARTLLNALQLAIETTPDTFPPKENETIHITIEAAEQSIQQKVVLYDKEGDYHFDVISAFIKSIRGSDPDAALYWMAKMISAGEHPRYIFRRMLISACEDVGLADPNALTVVNAASEAFERIGLPEGVFHLTQAALYLATAPKSNSSLAIYDAIRDVENEKNLEVPNHLRDASRDKKGFGHGEGYMYPHAFRDHWVAQQYLPTGMQGKVYYKPGSLGYEEKIKDNVERNRLAQLESVIEDAFVENLTFSPKNWGQDKWLERTSSNGSKLLIEIRDLLFENNNIKRHHSILVLNGSHGLFTWHAAKFNPEGFLLTQVKNKDQAEYINHYAQSIEELRRPTVKVGTPLSVLAEIEDEYKFDYVIGKNIFTNLKQSKDTLEKINNVLSEDGNLLTSESIPSLGSRLSNFIKDESVKKVLEKAEKEIYGDKTNNLVNWGEKELTKFLKPIFPTLSVNVFYQAETRFIDENQIEAWWKNSYSNFLNDNNDIKNALLNELRNKTLYWKHAIAIVKGVK